MSHSQITEAILVIEQTGQIFALDQDSITIGRKAGNTIALTEDSAVSRRHAIIFREAGHYIIQDAGSANGTFVNDQRLSGLQPLNDGDVLRLGRTTLTVHLPPLEDVASIAAEAEVPSPGEQPPARDVTIISATPPPVGIEKPTVALPKQPAQPGEPLTNRNILLIQESEGVPGDFDILDPESGQLLLQCIQVHSLVKSMLKAAGDRKRFDYWLRTPEDEPVTRITKGLAMLGSKPVAFRDENEQFMGELRQSGKPPEVSFEIFDALKELMFRVEPDAGKFKFLASEIQIADFSKAPPGSRPEPHAGLDQYVLEISNTVPKNSFIRGVILAAAISILLMVHPSNW